MVKVKAPFGGLEASGTIAGAITFAKTKGVQYARSHAVPSNPRSSLQLATRAMMAFLGARWSGMTTDQQDSWDPTSLGPGNSDFNRFIQYNMKRFTQFTWPIIELDQAAGTAPVMGALTATGQVGQISVSNVITTTNGIWGMAVAVSATTGFTPARSDVRAVFAGTASPITGVITRVAPGTWFVRTLGFNIGGTASAWVAEEEVTVT